MDQLIKKDTSDAEENYLLNYSAEFACELENLVRDEEFGCKSMNPRII
jgi:hypothetical protein